MLALVLMERGKFAEAEQVHLKGLELKPESPERWEGYACFLEDAGRRADAEAAYKKSRLFTGS
jgi:Flp pilus assembly protein TadD